MLWERMTDTAASLISVYGSEIDLIKNPPTPQLETGTNRPYWIVNNEKTYKVPDATRYAGFAAPRSVKVSEIVDGRIRVTDIVFMVTGIPEPTTKDKIEWLGEMYTIVHVDPKYLQSNVIVYSVFARKA